MPVQGRYRELGSCSNIKDYQANRLNIKFVDKDGKKKAVHTLNNTVLPTGRTIVAILENFQQKDGSVKIPEALWPYMSGIKVLKPVGKK
jgi:seryl-tRNA synthetase